MCVLRLRLEVATCSHTVHPNFSLVRFKGSTAGGKLAPGTWEVMCTLYQSINQSLFFMLDRTQAVFTPQNQKNSYFLVVF